MQLALNNWFCCLPNVMFHRIFGFLSYHSVIAEAQRQSPGSWSDVSWQQHQSVSELLTARSHLSPPPIFVIIMYNNPHLLLGRIRLLNRCIECLKRSESMPESLCYVPKEVCYKVCKDSSFSSSASSGVPAGGSKTLIPVFENPLQTPHIKKLCKYNIELKKGTCIRTTGEEYRNSQGLWVKITKVNLNIYNDFVLYKIVPNLTRIVVYITKQF